MNRVNQSVPPGDDIDSLLGAFFKHEMPKQWPAFAPPRQTLPFRPAKPGRSFFGSRAALAASVALLLLCGWLLSGSMPALTALNSDDPTVIAPSARKDKSGHRMLDGDDNLIGDGMLMPDMGK